MVVGGGKGGWSDRHTDQSALHGTGKDTKPNENKWPPLKAAPTLWAWFWNFLFTAFLLDALICFNGSL